MFIPSWFLQASSIQTLRKGRALAVPTKTNSPSMLAGIHQVAASLLTVDRIEVHVQSMKSIEELPFKEICWSDELQFETNSDTGLPKSRSMHIRRKSGRAIMATTRSKVTWKQGAIKQF